MPIKHNIIKNSTRRQVETTAIQKRLANKKNVFKIAGCLSNNDAAELKIIIEEGCERIDRDASKNLH